MKINGIHDDYGITRGPLRSDFNYGPFPKTLTFDRTDTRTGTKTRKTLDVKQEIDNAWLWITKKAATHQPCNNYFRKLAVGKSLAQILKEDIVLHALQPKEGKTDSDLPRGASGGNSIGINLVLIAEQNRAALCATMIHELAHVAGASIGSKSIEAETALKHCLLAQQFDPDALGVLHEREMERFAPTRVA